MSFGERLKHLREKHKPKIYQKELADGIGVSRQAITMWETGQRIPDTVTLQKIANYFKVSTDYLLGRTDYPSEIHELGALGVGGFIEKHGFQKIAEAGTGYDIKDEVDREVQAFHEKGIPIDRASARKIVEHRRRILQGEEAWIKYIQEAREIGEAYERLAELDSSLYFDDQTMLRFIRKAREKFGLPTPIETDLAAHGPKTPGTGVFDNEGSDKPK